MTNTIHLEEPDEGIIDFTPFEQYVDDMKDKLNVPSDWVYRPVGWMRNDFFDQFVDLVGDENMRFLSQMTRRIDGDMCTRASVYISPAGMDNIRAYNRSKDEADL